MVWYLDTSAFLKLITFEEESSAMRQWFSSHDSVWSSQLLHTEAMRVSLRLGIDVPRVEDALDTISLVLPRVTTFYAAGRRTPDSLQSLDALHLATAIEIGGDLRGMVVYDERLIEAARQLAIDTVTPR